jgi:CRISPR-associated protein Cmr6
MSTYNHNIGLKYNKLYYKDDKGKLIQKYDKNSKEKRSEINKELLESKITNNNILVSKEEKLKDNLSIINLKTTYPGLIIGSGYLHEAICDEDFKIGFFFDYTSGMPVIPASSVKGVLRSVFPNDDEDEDITEGKIILIKEILSSMDIEDNDIIKELEEEIFEGKSEKCSKRDIFFDAEIVSELEKKFLDVDYITPHGDDKLKNPNPIKFLKIAPNVTIRFSLLLNDGIITAEQKKEFFKEILLIIGIGAKTNVGYGRLINDEN